MARRARDAIIGGMGDAKGRGPAGWSERDRELVLGVALRALPHEVGKLARDASPEG